MYGRVYSRLQLFKRRKREAEEREFQRQTKAARMVQKVFREHQTWSRFLHVIVGAIRRDLQRHR